MEAKGHLRICSHSMKFGLRTAELSETFTLKRTSTQVTPLEVRGLIVDVLCRKGKKEKNKNKNAT